MLRFQVCVPDASAIDFLLSATRRSSPRLEVLRLAAPIASGAGHAAGPATTAHDMQSSARPAEVGVQEAPQSQEVQMASDGAAGGRAANAQWHAMAAAQASQCSAALERGCTPGGLVDSSANRAAQFSQDKEMAASLQLHFIRMDVSWAMWRLRTHSLHMRMAGELTWLSPAWHSNEIFGHAAESLETAEHTLGAHPQSQSHDVAGLAAEVAPNYTYAFLSCLIFAPGLLRSPASNFF